MIIYFDGDVKTDDVQDDWLERQSRMEVHLRKSYGRVRIGVMFRSGRRKPRAKRSPDDYYGPILSRDKRDDLGQRAVKTDEEFQAKKGV